MPGGIYDGSLEGEIEPGETDEEAILVAVNFLKKYAQGFSEPYTSIFVTNGTMEIEAPGATIIPINLVAEFKI